MERVSRFPAFVTTTQRLHPRNVMPITKKSVDILLMGQFRILRSRLRYVPLRWLTAVDTLF